MKSKIFLCLFISLLLTINVVKSDESCYLLKQSLMFYKAQRAGRLPDNDIPWRGNSVLTDKSAGSSLDSNGDGDLSKGYFDAGDGVKFHFPMAYSMTMLGWSYLEYSNNIEKCGLGTLYREVLKWGTDFLIASHTSDNVFVCQVGDGNVDHSVWQPPEDINYVRQIYTIDSNNPGTDVAMEAASALAAASLVFKTSNPTYSDLCLQHAKKLYTFAMTAPMKVNSQSNPFYISSGYWDEVTWGSIWLYKATKNQTYMNNAALYYTYGNVQYANEFSWDDKGVGTSLLLYQLSSDSKYKTNLENSFNNWLPGGGVKYTPGGLAWLREWGPCRYSLVMGFLQSVYSIKNGGNSKYNTFAMGQLSYVLGNNTKKQSFVTGYGPNAPKNPHHRAAHHPTDKNINIPVNNTYQLLGGLVGGPKDNDEWTDDRTNYVTNEVALDYNVGLVGSLAAYATGSDSSSSSTGSTAPSTTSSQTSATTSQSTTSSSTSQSTTSSTTSKPTTSSTTSQSTTSSTTSHSTTSSTTSKPTTTSSTTSPSSTTSRELGESESEGQLNYSISLFIGKADLVLLFLLSIISMVFNL
ncbi:hypothetical protein RB653_000365 [Dictyostelium firmibasis]|uniref:Endoglucanase n=1 Tax=Dictyostelium firmibasis TaxID=79012 RepID=A0AAN7TV48_9MYCE